MDNLYLKYRPKTFSQIVGQPHIVKLFENALKKEKVSHSYLFAGPRGTGKTSTARILAKALNCEHLVNGYEPCNECKSCVAIDSGRSMDVIEMDAASNRGIDEIRGIRDKVSYLPAESKYKVYIIDEVHMLTKEAFNALLKTLEEPPEHTFFILATTEMQKVPETILSRCQIVEFHRISNTVIEKRLKEICKKEGIKYQDEAIKHIARRANGGMRDAISLLEEASRFSSLNITLEDVLQVLGEAPEEEVEKYVSALLNGNTDVLVSVIENIEKQGTDVESFLNQTLDFVSERVLENEMAEIGKFISDLLYRLRFEERSLDIFKILSIFESLKHSNVDNSREGGDGKEKVENAKKIEKKSSTPKSDTEKFLEWYAKDGNISIFACLAKAEIKDFADRLLIISDTPLCHEVLKSNCGDMENEFEKLTSRKVKILIAYSAIPLSEIELKTREAIVKALSIFGGKVLPEGGEEIV
ncbi:DNA polymerase III subunit gamma/tau [Mesoaciditoga sp.]